MKKQIQTRSLLGVLIVLIVFTALTVVIPRYYALRDVQNQILNADENEIELSSNVLVSENKLGIMAVINPFDNSINDLKAEINRDLSLTYDKHVKILDALIGKKNLNTYGGPHSGWGTDVGLSKRLSFKAKDKLEKAKKLNQSNRVESVRLLEQSLRYMDKALDINYHHATGTQSTYYDVILEDFGIEGETETLLGYIETMYEYDRAEEHATAYYYFILYNEEGSRLLEEHVKPLVEKKYEEAKSKYDEAKNLFDTVSRFEEPDDPWIYERLTNDIYYIGDGLSNGKGILDIKDYPKANMTFDSIIERTNKYISEITPYANATR